MDSSKVNKEIKRVIKPYLIANGFIKNSPRNFWKHNEDTIWVVNFQSFNSYHAGVMNITTFSFSINLGIFWLRFPTYGNVKKKGNLLLPQEYECQIRHSVTKSIQQDETNRKTIWYVDREGRNLYNALDDALISIRKIVPSWFIKFSDKQECLELILKEDEKMEGTFGFGNKNSPIRNLLAGYLSYWIGNHPLANHSLKNALNSGCFPNWQNDIVQLIDLTD